MRHAANIDQQRNGDYIIQTFSGTVNGFDIGDGVPIRIGSGAGAEEIGAVVLDALNRSREDHPAVNLREENPVKQFLEFVGEPSFGKYMRGVRSIFVDAVYDDSPTVLHITPYRNEGARGGFTPIAELERDLAYISPEQLGEEVLGALRDAIP